MLVERMRELTLDGATLDEAIEQRPAQRRLHHPHSGQCRQRALRRVAGARRWRRRWPTGTGLDLERILELGRGPDNDAEQFDMTAFSLRETNGANAVSQLHAMTANATWSGVGQQADPGHHQRRPPAELGRRSPIRQLYESIGGDLDNLDPQHQSFLKKIAQLPDEQLWDAHRRQKLELAYFCRRRLQSQFARHGEAPQPCSRGSPTRSTTEVLTIGFARRFATYKRAALIFSDEERLARILLNEERPVQIVFAGKAHPADRPGQRVIQDIFTRSRSPKFAQRVFVLEDYDIRIGRYLVQGVDVWLNNPRRPLEASGTSGMKAAMNGVVNVSVLDGWWDEAYNGRERLGNWWPSRWTPTKARRTGRMPRRSTGCSRRRSCRRTTSATGAACPGSGWTRCGRRWRSTIWEFSTSRMLQEYVEELYLPAAERRCCARAGAQRSRQRRAAADRHPAAWAMTKLISLALVIHNHQPVGNFGWVIEDVYEKAYAPMIGALERTRASMRRCTTAGRCSNGWDASDRPRSSRLRALVERRQVEILGGGLYEPILVALPERDRLGQLMRMREYVERLFGCAAARRLAGGARLGAVAALRPCADAGYTYTVLDDNHLRAAFVPEEHMWGTFTTDDQGRLVTLFGDREGPALPHPVEAGRGADRLPARIGAPRPVSGWGSWATTARSSAPGRAPTRCAGRRRTGSSAASTRSRRTPTG